MTSNLKTVVGMNKFCGPAVLSILTGKSTDECAAVISRINGQYQVRGVLLNDLLLAAERLGFDSKAVDSAGSLFGTIVRLVHNDGMYIVMVPSHFVTIEVKDKKAFFCDNHTKEPIPAASSARLGQKVISVYKVTKRPEIVLPPIPPKIFMKYRYDVTLDETDRSVCVDKIAEHVNSVDNYVKQSWAIGVDTYDEWIELIAKLKEKLCKLT